MSEPFEDLYREIPDPKFIGFTTVDLPCGCQDLHYADGRVDREHDYVQCDGKPSTDDSR